MWYVKFGKNHLITFWVLRWLYVDKIIASDSRWITRFIFLIFKKNIRFYFLALVSSYDPFSQCYYGFFLVEIYWYKLLKIIYKNGL